MAHELTGRGGKTSKDSDSVADLPLPRTDSPADWHDYWLTRSLLGDREVEHGEAIRLLPRVVRGLEIRGWNADLLLLLDDGRILAFWAESDYGPAYWTIES